MEVSSDHPGNALGDCQLLLSPNLELLKNLIEKKYVASFECNGGPLKEELSLGWLTK